jgi:hypothetical protein
MPRALRTRKNKSCNKVNADFTDLPEVSTRRLQWRWFLGETAIPNQAKVLHWMTEDIIPKFIIERTMPGAGALDRQQLAAITQAS